ncbi:MULTISPECIES: hypothetical protein [Nocardioides]|uniref:DUF2470 domain-containing protein n=1 Tax=Nocardioides vastitatis TaxID=2568655 RepID=A0ABW0ZJS0_9ACTN|nr:hypothetical protein [Nocardioides sp.]THJ04477.1 hypothetical protein E7Z54_08275 [Nocardioides sp.]
MTPGPGIDTGRVDVSRLAAAARSILACPQEVQLVVDGVDDVVAGLDEPDLDLQDHSGRPVFSCPAGSALGQAATDRRGAVLTVGSGLGSAGSPDREASLTLYGRLEATGLEDCPCCGEVRMRVSLHLGYVLLSRASAPDGASFRVPLADFVSREHDLNRGFLQRSAEHANSCHQDELRRAVSTTTGTRVAEIAGVHLADLRADGVELQWVDASGGHRSELTFARSARSAEELGELLRTELHAGLC